jgi:hypothetical protein
MKPFILFLALLMVLLPALSLDARDLPDISLPDVPLDEEELYRNYERAIACGFAKGFSIGDRPISREDFVRLLGEVGARDDEAARLIYEDSVGYFEKDLPLFGLESDVPTSSYFWEPITTVRDRIYYLDSPLDFYRLENSDGEKLEQGLNHFLDVTGRGQASKYASLFYQIQLNNNRETNKLSLKKGYAKFRWKSLALKAGKDLIWWGPAFRGDWVLSNNAREFGLVQLKTEAPFRLPWIFKHLGEFRFDFAHLWLDDDHRVHSDPKMIAMRGSYMPVSWFEIALNRTTMYGGSGLEEPSSLSEWWDLITGSKEKVPGAKIDSETFVGYDVSLNMPFLRKLTWNIIKGGRLYQERASPDASAPWQEGRDEFRLISDSNLYGLYLTTGITDFRIESGRSRSATYAPDTYPAGYTYRSFIIGHPLGRDGEGIYLEVSRRFSDRLRVTAFYIDEEHGIKAEEGPEKVREFGLDLKYKLNLMGQRIELEGGGIFSRIRNLDVNTDPIRFTISDRDENEWFTYIGARWRW